MRIRVLENWVDVVLGEVRLSQGFSMSAAGNVDLIEWMHFGRHGYHLITWMDELGGETTMFDPFGEFPRRWN